MSTLLTLSIFQPTPDTLVGKFLSSSSFIKNLECQSSHSDQSTLSIKIKTYAAKLFLMFPALTLLSACDLLHWTFKLLTATYRNNLLSHFEQFISIVALPLLGLGCALANRIPKVTRFNTEPSSAKVDTDTSDKIQSSRSLQPLQTASCDLTKKQKETRSLNFDATQQSHSVLQAVPTTRPHVHQQPDGQQTFQIFSTDKNKTIQIKTDRTEADRKIHTVTTTTKLITNQTLLDAINNSDYKTIEDYYLNNALSIPAVSTLAIENALLKVNADRRAGKDSSNAFKCLEFLLQRNPLDPHERAVAIAGYLNDLTPAILDQSGAHPLDLIELVLKYRTAEDDGEKYMYQCLVRSKYEKDIFYLSYLRLCIKFNFKTEDFAIDHLLRLIKEKEAYDLLELWLQQQNLARIETILWKGIGNRSFIDCPEDKKIVELALKYKANPNKKNANGQYPLLQATNNNQTEIIELLIKYGADVNMSFSDDKTPIYLPLMKAIQKKKAAIVKLLLDHGADPNKEVLDMRPIDKALSDTFYEPDVVNHLLSHGAKVELSDIKAIVQRNNRSNLEHLIAASPIESFDFLLGLKQIEKLELFLKVCQERKIALDTVMNGVTCLSLAMVKCNELATEFLLNAGAKIDIEALDNLICYYTKPVLTELRAAEALQKETGLEKLSSIEQLGARDYMTQIPEIKDNIFANVLLREEKVLVYNANAAQRNLDFLMRYRKKAREPLIALMHEATDMPSVHIAITASY